MLHTRKRDAVPRLWGDSKSIVLHGRVHRHQKPDKSWCEIQFTFGDAAADFEKYLLQWMCVLHSLPQTLFLAAEFFGRREVVVATARVVAVSNVVVVVVANTFSVTPIAIAIVVVLVVAIAIVVVTVK